MMQSRRPGLSLLLYALLVLLFAPMIVIGFLWGAFVLSGAIQTPDMDNVRAAILVWMTIAIAGAAICVFAEVLFAPFVLRLLKVPAHWARACVYLLSGLISGAAAYVLLGGSANPIAAVRASGFVL